MKVVLLAGGFGTRISEESALKPKPMIEIGGRPVLWHIMKLYSHYGHNEFIICLGYKGYVIKEFFANYFLHQSDVTIDLKNNDMEIHRKTAEPWKVTLVDTGSDSMTGGRVARVKEYIDDTFLLTYGDGLSDININHTIEAHKASGATVTLTSTKPPGRFGSLEISENGKVERFVEKPRGDNSWINAGFFVCEPKLFDHIEGDHTVLEKEPLENLASAGELNSFKYEGFWQPMDTLRDKKYLEGLWETEPPWRVWEQ